MALANVSSSDSGSSVVIVPRRLVRRLIFAAVACVSVLMFVVTILKVFFNRDNLLGLARLFNPHFEASAHAWLGSVLLVLCAALLLLIGTDARSKRAKLWHIWYVLGWGFAFLSFDEAAEIHEMSADVLRYLMPGKFIVGEAFAFIAGVAGLAMLPLFWGFLKSLTPKYRKWFTICGVIYVGGAVGMEGVAAIQEYSGWWSVSFHDLLACAEETLELAGAGLFLCTLLDYSAEEAGIGVAFARPEAAAVGEGTLAGMG